jgi:hypothetical protein
MSRPSLALDHFGRWIDAEDVDGGVSTYRRVFAGIWLLYDVIDITWGTTERALDWFPHHRSAGLVALQAALVVSGLMLLWGRGIWAFGMIAAATRATEALVYFRLNDFFFASVVYLLLAHSTGGPFGKNRRPKWVGDVLLVEFAFTYVATALLKANPDWLGGTHLFVRTQYLFVSRSWPYPGWLEPLLATLAVDAFLAKLALIFELALAGVLLARRPYWLGAILVVVVHAFGAFMTNVWFLSATMISGVVLLLPRPSTAPSSGR